MTGYINRDKHRQFIYPKDAIILVNSATAPATNYKGEIWRGNLLAAPLKSLTEFYLSKFIE